MKFRGGEFSTGTKGNFQSELTRVRLPFIVAGWNDSPRPGRIVSSSPITR
jgi:hypothetical protein